MDQDEYKQQQQMHHQRINFYSNIPKSFIVFDYQPKGNNEMNEIEILKRKASELFLKYIQYGATYEIDVTMQLEIVNIMENEEYFIEEYDNNTFKLSHIFDGVIDQLLESLVDCFVRFKDTKQYQQLLGPAIKQFFVN
eukprot:433579_1